MAWVRSGVLVVACGALLALGTGVSVARADEQTCAALNEMSTQVDDPANASPVVSEALIYLRGENPAYEGLDRQIDAVTQAQVIIARMRDGVRSHLAEVTDPNAKQQLTAYADGLDGAESLASTWISASPEVRSSPDMIDRANQVGGLMFDGINNFHVLLHICNQSG